MYSFTFNYYTISLLIGGFTALISGLVVFFQNRRVIENQTWFALTLCTSIWSFGYFFMTVSTGHEMGMISNWILHYAAIFIPLFYFLLVLVITKSYSRFNRVFYFFYTLALLFVFINLSPYFISDVRPKVGFNFAPVPGTLYFYFFLYFVFLVVSGIIVTIITILRTKEQNEKFRLWYTVFFTIAASVGGGSVFMTTFFDNIPPYPLILFSIYPAISGYAILRHQLFDAKIIATQMVTFGLWTFILLRVLLAETFHEQLINAGLLVLMIFFGLLLIKGVYREVRQREKIEKLAGELGETNDRQEKLIHFIGHEVKGYLTKSEGAFSGMMEGDYGPISDEVKTLATLALKEDRKGVKAVTDILRASNQKKGTVSYEMKPFDFKQMVSRAVAEIKPEVETKGLKINLNVEMAPSYEVNGDENQLEEHLVRNLLKNAINYTPSGSITVSLSRIENKILFSVKDTGIGINEEDKTKLFTEGGRGKESIKVNVNSTGYGLFIAKGIVDAHHGKIWVDSLGSGKGSTFYVELLAY